jgi:hypothetical protein
MRHTRSFEQTGITYKSRLINSGAGFIEYFSIDNHWLTTTSNDFVDMVPYNTTIVTLGASVSMIEAMIFELTGLKTGLKVRCTIHRSRKWFSLHAH